MNTKVISLENLKGVSLSKDGLQPDEVSAQRSKFGDNQFMEELGTAWWQILWNASKDPMILLLVFAGSIFLVIGNRHEAITLYAAILPLLVMDLYLHHRTELSTKLLKKQISRSVSVLRKGENVQIDYIEIVPGDLIIVQTGDLLSADGFFEHVEDLLMDESTLTGESLPISKYAHQISQEQFYGEISVANNVVGFAGTRVVRGRGILRVTETGINTEYGMIVQSLSKIPKERTALQKNIAQLVKVLTLGGLGCCVFLAVIRISQGEDVLSSLLSAAILAVAAMPEEFPIVFSFFLGVGVYRLAKSNALVRRAVTVESIGQVKCICTDKTGTMTMGDLKLEMAVAAEPVSKEFLIESAFKASDVGLSDPIDLAIYEACKNRSVDKKVKIYPFTELRRKETVICQNHGDQMIAICKGAPEVIFSMCNMSDDARSLWRQRVSKYSSEGMKVLACAHKIVSSHDSLENEPNAEFELLGILGFSDSLRPGVDEAIGYCRRHGIKVIMLTGDHPQTAMTVAKNAGMGHGSPRVLSMEDHLDLLDQNNVTAKISLLARCDVISRCNPLQKLWIVQALKTEFDVIAVTGDGVNDVPALQQADIGIAMGKRGSRAAREIASIILADDNFATIIKAIREGKQLFRNLSLSFEYLLLMQIPLVLGALLVPLFGYPLLFLPIHLVWIELIIHPTSLLGFQMSASQNDSAPEIRFFDKDRIIAVSVNGLIVCFLMIVNFIVGLKESKGTEHARANALIILILAGITFHLSTTKLRTRGSISIFVFSIVTTIALFQIDEFAKPLSIAPLDGGDWIRAIGLVVISSLLSWLTVVSRFR